MQPNQFTSAAPYLAQQIPSSPQQQMVKGANYDFQLSANGLDNKKAIGKCNPFLIISRPRDPMCVPTSYKTQSGGNLHLATDWIVVHKTETVPENQNPVWKPFVLDLGQLCFNNVDTPFLVECYDHENGGKHKFIGSTQSTIRELQVMKEMQFKNPKRNGISKVSGMLTVVKCTQV